MSDVTDNKVGRREFVGAAAAASAMIIKPELVWGTEVNSAVRLGLLGCPRASRRPQAFRAARRFRAGCSK